MQKAIQSISKPFFNNGGLLAPDRECHMIMLKSRESVLLTLLMNIKLKEDAFILDQMKDEEN
jgi:hypothetical protein